MESTQTVSKEIELAQQQLRIATRFEDDILELLLVLHSFNNCHNLFNTKDITIALEQWLHSFQDILEKNTIAATNKYNLLRNQ